MSESNVERKVVRKEIRIFKESICSHSFCGNGCTIHHTYIEYDNGDSDEAWTITCWGVVSWYER